MKRIPSDENVCGRRIKPVCVIRSCGMTGDSASNLNHWLPKEMYLISALGTRRSLSPSSAEDADFMASKGLTS
ncbi:hypothetical protein BgiBS90_005303 [Biomphalaria glabrata]|nr:hypothetical protein BgiBS90_005303 [Biomphalaria glabrata]